MSEHSAWLSARTPAAPSALRTALEAELANRDAAAPAAFAEAGVAALRDAIALGDDRAAAYRLLAADAMLTYAIEAAAEQGLETVSAVVETWGPDAVARTLEVESA